MNNVPLDTAATDAVDASVAVAPDTSAATMVLRLGYRGTEFSGFAAQPGQRTVAGELIRALETFLRREVEIHCAGRTDAGVHAIAQHVSLPVTKDELALSSHRVISALNALVPDDISIQEVYRARQGFSARFDALARTYRYRISDGGARPILAQDSSWWLRDTLDLKRMNEAANYLLGEQDFKSFCKAVSAEGKPTKREVQYAATKRVEESGEELVVFDIRANAFLHSMVRTIVGTLVEVGRGARSPIWVKEVVAAKDRIAAGMCAPAQGLVFSKVDYDPGALAAWDSTTE